MKNIKPLGIKNQAVIEKFHLSFEKLLQTLYVIFFIFEHLVLTY